MTHRGWHVKKSSNQDMYRQRGVNQPEYPCSLTRLIILHYVSSHTQRGIIAIAAEFEGWSQDCSKSDGCFFQYLISSPWRRYEDYNISFCKQWKFRCHCSYDKGVKVAPKQGFQKYVWVTSLALNPRLMRCFWNQYFSYSSMKTYIGGP